MSSSSSSSPATSCSLSSEGGRGRLVQRQDEVVVGAEGAGGGAVVVGSPLGVDAAGELVEAAGVDAEVEDDADGEEHQHDERADSACLARVVAHILL
uniref:Uncharacterized protein n=1 Tax=Oryza brachyantha TaxID=4533 RepID=J3N142_ORYBR